MVLFYRFERYVIWKVTFYVLEEVSFYILMSVYLCMLNLNFDVYFLDLGIITFI